MLAPNIFVEVKIQIYIFNNMFSEIRNRPRWLRKFAIFTKYVQMIYTKFYNLAF